MSAIPWVCRCGTPGVRNIGSFGYCGLHLAELLSTFSPDSFAMNGVMLLAGKRRPEFGDGMADVRCNAPGCGATYLGREGEACKYCRRTRDAVIEHQREMLLRPPDELTDESLTAWGHRLRRGVDAGIITRKEAEAAWRKVVVRVA